MNFFRTQNKIILVSEFTLLFIVLPLIYVSDLYRPPIILVLLLLGLYALIILRSDRDFDRRSLWRADFVQSEIKNIIFLLTISSLILITLIAIFSPARLFILIRTHPLIWLILIVAYPIISVYPQELFFRALFFHRYRALFRSDTIMILASSTVFGFAHLIFLHWIPVVLTFIGGLFFATRYHRTKSLAAVGLEHSLFGLMVFTLGLGEYFFAGTSKFILSMMGH